MPGADVPFPEAGEAESAGLVVEHRNHDGALALYDFARLPVPEALQRSFAVLFAARGRALAVLSDDVASAQARPYGCQAGGEMGPPDR